MVIEPVALSSAAATSRGAAWLEPVFRAHYATLVGVARLLADDRGSAEEIVQEAFVRLHLNRWRIRDPERVDAYLRSTVLNLCRGRLRRLEVARRHAPMLVGDADAPRVGDGTASSDARHRVIAAIRQLPGRQRECMVLRYYGDLSEREIAAALGIAPGSVKSHIHRATATLAETLKDLR